MQKNINVGEVHVEGNATALPSVKVCLVVAGQCFGKNFCGLIFDHCI